MKKLIMVIVFLLCSFIGVNMVVATSWTPKTDFGGTLRGGGVGFSIGTKGYVGLGIDIFTSVEKNDFWEFDPTTNVWTQQANFGGTARHCAVGFSIGSKGYIGTGVVGHAQTPSDVLNSVSTKDFWEYDPVGNTWTQMADFGGAARGFAAGFSIGTKGYIGTGYAAGGSFSTMSDFWEYDSATKIWTKKADISARAGAVGFSIGTNGYIGAGLTPSGFGTTELKDFWEYNPSTDTWTRKTDLVQGREIGVGFSIGSKGYIGTGQKGASISGLSGYMGTGSKDFWEYNPTANTWAQKLDFGGTARAGAVAFAIGTKGYIGSGGQPALLKNDFWEFDPADTTPLDTTPNAFTFAAQTGVPINSVVTSNSITVSGLNAAAPVSITAGAYYSINGGAFTSSAGLVSNDDTITVHLTSSASYSTTTKATLTIGGVSNTFVVTTYAADTTPDQFTFIAQTGVALNTVITSNTINVSGINKASTISITTGGTYSVNGGAYTAKAGTVNNGDKVIVRQTSAMALSTTKKATVTIGGVSGTFSVTTRSKLI